MLLSIVVLLCMLVAVQATQIPLDPDSFNPVTGEPYVASVTVANSTFGLVLGSACLLGVLFGFAFTCIWSSCLGDRKGVRVRSARESIVKGSVYTSTLPQPSTSSCAIM